MIQTTRLVSHADVELVVFRCDGRHKPWSGEEPVAESTLTVVQRGSFQRRVEGKEVAARPLIAYVEQPGTTQSFAHPESGDVCTGITLSERVLGDVLDPDRLGPGGVLHMDPPADVDHRLLLRAHGRGVDTEQVVELAISFSGALIERCGRTRENDRAASVRQRHLADGIREALQASPASSLTDLAAMLDRSIYQLSRAFSLATGGTISRYRLKLRCHLAIDRIAAGDTNLAGVAVEAGFADQAHMSRTLRRELTTTPGRLRELLGGGPASSLAQQSIVDKCRHHEHREQNPQRDPLDVL